MKREVFKKLKSNELKQEHYISLMKELCYLLSENTRICTLASSRFNASDMNKIRDLLEDVLLTMDLDKKVLADLNECGSGVDKYFAPLASTHALYSSTYYNITYLNPYMIIGHLFMLGQLATLAEGEFYYNFRRIGVKDDAMKTFIFFRDNQYRPFKLIRTLLEGFDLSEKEVAMCCHTIKNHCNLFVNLMEESFDRVEYKEYVITV
jgi:hypothetical protein